MGIIIRFPGRRRHDRAPAGSSGDGPGDFRAASDVMRSAVNPAAPAVGVSRIDCHHSSGIRSRCDHLRTAATPAEISAAIDSGEGQSPIISRNDVGASDIMDSSLGQFVLNCKAKVSRDYEQGTSDNEPMAQKLSESDHLKAFIERTRLARLSHSLHQTRICTILEIDQGTYKQYERRTPLPHRHIPKFCAATGVRFEWLLANEGQGPDLSRVPKNLLERPTRRHRAASKRHKAA